MSQNLARQVQAAIKASQAKGGLSLQRAVVVSWDASDGFTINLAGAAVGNPPVLESTGTLAPGDVVAVLRQKSAVLVIGKITSPS